MNSGQKRKFRYYVARASELDRQGDGYLEPCLDGSDRKRHRFTSIVLSRIVRHGPHNCYIALKSAPSASRDKFSPYYVSLCRLASEELDWPGCTRRRPGIVRNRYDLWAVEIGAVDMVVRPIRARFVHYYRLLRDGDLVWVDGKPLPYEDAVFELGDIVTRKWRVGIRTRAASDPTCPVDIRDEHGNVICSQVAGPAVARHIVDLHNAWLSVNEGGYIKALRTEVEQHGTND